MDVTTNCRKYEGAFAGTALHLVHVGFQMGHRGLHHLGGLEHEGQLHRPGAEELPHDLHAPEQVLVIGFVPATGTTGFKGYLGMGKKKTRAKKGSIERHILDNYNPDYAFISLRNEPSRKEIADNKIDKSNLMGLTQFKMDMLSVVDAFFYLKEEHLVSFP